MIKSKRNSSLELLRIISMVLIVAHHYAIHGFDRNLLDYNYNKYIIDFLIIGGKLGVNCFVLISAYFMIESKITLKKLMKLWTEIWFYSIVILIIFYIWLVPDNFISFKVIIKNIFPVVYSQYWFMTNYIVLMILSPYLNKCIKMIGKDTHQSLILVLTIMWSIILMLFPKSDLGFSFLGWFIFLYIIASYIKLYVHLSLNYMLHLKRVLIGIAIYLISILAFNLFGDILNNKFLLKNSIYLSNPKSILLLFISVELLMMFLSMKKWSNKFVNIIASATLGVYLIHDNNFVRPYLWKDLLDNQSMYHSEYLIFHAICSIILVYIICTIIDLLRQLTIEKLYEIFWNKYGNIMENKLYFYFYKIKEKVFIFYNK